MGKEQVKKQKKEKEQKSIEQTLWDAANKLRDKVEPSVYKHVVLSLIFLKYAMTAYQFVVSLLAYINNPYGVGDGLNYLEDCEDVDTCKCVFKMIFDAPGQSQRYKMKRRC